MTISGNQLINGQWVEGTAGSYNAVNPATGETLEPAMSKASSAQVEEAVAAAEAAAATLRKSSLEQRAQFLNTCADEILALGDELVQRAMAETGLPEARIIGERGRTMGQLRMFADYVVKGDYLDARIDTAMPDREPLPRPDLRYVKQSIGPVAVFGASNFPLAFSVAGGDTASAFAAGCPVLVKGHSSHSGTSELMAQALARAVEKCGLPSGTFSLLMGAGREVGSALVQAPEIKAVGFTGSLAGGMALVKLSNERPEPIPVFAEMGSVNPVVLLPEALKERADKIAEGFAFSLNMGVGQFCTNPGLVLAIDGPELNQFIEVAGAKIADQPAGVMLNETIHQAYQEGVSNYCGQTETLAQGGESDGTGFKARAALLSCSAQEFIANPKIHEEIFGPVSLIVRCSDAEELVAAVSALKGQLTGTVHCADGELASHSALADVLAQRVGRLLINGFPTGVEVCHAMVHGGPFPAATDVRFTSVGSTAIDRFVRPICLQNYPQELLPDALKNENPLGILRTVNGEKTREGI